MKIYTVGVGTAKGGPIPIKQNGIVTSYKKDIEGNVVVTKADSQTLKNIASTASGDYIDGTSTATVVNKIKDVLGKNVFYLAKPRLSNTRTATSGSPEPHCCSWYWIP